MSILWDVCVVRKGFSLVGEENIGSRLNSAMDSDLK